MSRQELIDQNLKLPVYICICKIIAK